MEKQLQCTASVQTLSAWIEGLDQFNRTPGVGTTRQYLTAEDMSARAWLKGEFAALGLEVAEDCMGNLYGTLPGSDPALAPVWTGSHFDTVLHGGKYDGIAGVVAGMEALRLIRSSGLPHRRSLTVVGFAAEEPARFGIGCIGSRALAGRLDVEALKLIHALDGPSLYDELKRCGYDCDRIGALKKQPGDVFCTLELHIEQNCQLEQAGVTLGLVKAICAPLNLLVTVTGQASHAGGTPMNIRRDAFAAACEMSLALEQLVRSNPNSEYCVGTVGSVMLEPGASNVIPGKAQFTVDIRDCSPASKDWLLEQVQTSFAGIAQHRGVELAIEIQNNDTPAVSSPALLARLEHNCAARGVSAMPLISGAFHDSLFTALFAPGAMLFIPSKAGLSHCPEEWSSVDDLARGAEVLADTLYQLSEQEGDMPQ